MHIRLMRAIFAPLLLCLSTAAQDSCPAETARLVESKVITGDIQDCHGISVTIGDVEVYSTKNGCPLFLIYEPEHHIAVPSRLRTKVELLATQPITRISFGCEDRYFLWFIPYGSRCIELRSANIGSLPLFVTVPCADAGPVENTNLATIAVY